MVSYNNAKAKSRNEQADFQHPKYNICENRNYIVKQYPDRILLIVDIYYLVVSFPNNTILDIFKTLYQLLTFKVSSTT